jgi:O-antigen/teichoic acid export membrane protein
LPLLTNLLTPAEYSLVALAIAAATYFSLIAADPITLAFQRFPGDRDDRGAYRYALTRVAVFLVALGGIAVLLSLVFGFWEAIVAIVGWGIGLAVTRLISMAWLMWAEPWKYSANLILSTAIRTIGVVALVYSGVDGALAVGIAGLASAVAALCISPRIRGTRRILRAPWSWRFGVHLALASLAGTLLTSAGLIMLPLFVGSTQVGQFAAMTQLATLTCGALLGLVLTVAYPALRRMWDEGKAHEAAERIEWLTTLCLAVALLTTAAFSAGGYWLPALVVGDSFLDVRILPILVLSTCFASMGQLSSWFHQFKFEAFTVSRRTWISATFGILATAVGSWLFGITGAAVGVAIGFLVYYLVLRFRTGLGIPAAFISVFACAGAISISTAPTSGGVATAVTCAVSALTGVVLSGYLAWRLLLARR